MNVCLNFIRGEQKGFVIETHLRGFNVVVEVVPERLDVGDNFISSLSS
jgi:hypothetical protein